MDQNNYNNKNGFLDFSQIKLRHCDEGQYEIQSSGQFYGQDDLKITSNSEQETIVMTNVKFRKGYKLIYSVLFRNWVQDEVGKHAGVILCGQSDSRERIPQNGIVIDWIDRNDPQGYRFYRTSQNIINFSQNSNGNDRITITWTYDNYILFSVNNIQYKEKGENLNEDGYIGFWAWKGIQVSFYNIQLLPISEASWYNNCLGFIDFTKLQLNFSDQQGGTWKIASKIQNQCNDELQINSQDSEIGVMTDLKFSKGYKLSYKVKFRNWYKDDVGRHGGIILGGPKKGGPRIPQNGLVIDWIDRNDPTGYRFYRADQKFIHFPQPQSGQGNDDISIFWNHNDQLIFKVNQIEYRENSNNLTDGGYIGFWGWKGNQISFYNVKLEVMEDFDKYKNSNGFLDFTKISLNYNDMKSGEWTVQTSGDQYGNDDLQITSGYQKETGVMTNIQFRQGYKLSYKVLFRDWVKDQVGRHGGLILGGQTKGGPRCPKNGIVIDWIDRNDPSGYRFYRVDNKFIHFPYPYSGTGNDEISITWNYDNQLIFKVNNSIEYKEKAENLIEGGYIGFWAWNGNKISFYNVRLDSITI